jgi:hypothetical protein
MYGSHSILCPWLPLAAAIELQTQLDNSSSLLTVRACHASVLGWLHQEEAPQSWQPLAFKDVTFHVK